MIRAMAVGAALMAISLATEADAQTSGRANIYNVTVEQCELCSDANCTSSSVIRSGNQTFDIASAGIGQTIGQYASTTGLPFGTTFTHLRVTVNRTIAISGTIAVAGLGNCATNSANASSNATTAGVGTLGGAATTQQLFVPNVGAIGGNPTAAQYSNLGISIVDADSFTFTTALTSPVTVGTKPPAFNIGFSTANALQAFNNGGACGMLPAPPVITATLQ
jgi:hypothetical protein